MSHLKCFSYQYLTLFDFYIFLSSNAVNTIDSNNDKYVLFLHSSGEYTSEQGRYVGDFINGTFHGTGTMHVKEGRFEGVLGDEILSSFSIFILYLFLLSLFISYLSINNLFFVGKWEHGVMTDGIYVFDDDLQYKRTGKYDILYPNLK